MNVSDFDFELPDALIAQEPAQQRGASRLLVLDRRSGELTHTTFPRIGDFLCRDDLLVVNDTRVFPARLIGHRVPSGGAVEFLLLEAGSGDTWDALVHPGQKLKPGAKVEFNAPGRRLFGEVVSRHFHGRRSVRLWTEEGTPVADVIDAIGHIPLPPYIKRPDSPEDRDRYQTVYAAHRGSVAAPTAGLHFTEAILSDLESRGVERAAITLHVGYGTFKPVRVERVEDHTVDPEVVTISEGAASAIALARRNGGRVVAVGTTTARALESRAQGRGVPTGSGMAGLFIYPGVEFHVVDALVTNFHLPKSSLLMLVAAFAGRERILAAYREAVALGYRFYSYGDAMLIV